LTQEQGARPTLVLLKSKFNNKVIIFPIIIWLTEMRILKNRHVICLILQESTLLSIIVSPDNYFDLDHSEDAE